MEFEKEAPKCESGIIRSSGGELWENIPKFLISFLEWPTKDSKFKH